MAAHGLPPESLSSLLDFLGAFGLHSTTSALLTELRARGDSLPDVEGLDLPFSPLSDGGDSPHAESPMSPGALDAGLGGAARPDMGTYAGSSPFQAPLQPASPPRPISPQQVPWDENVNEYDGPDDVGYDRRDVVGQRHFVEVELDLASDAPDAASHSQQQYSQGARTTTSGDFSRADSEDRGSSCGSSISGAVIDLMPTSNSGACALPPGSPAGTSSSKPRALDDLVWDMGPVGIRIAEPVTTPTKSSSVVNADEPKPVLSRVESLSSSFKDFEIERTDDELPSRRTSGGQLNARATSSQAGAELSGGSTSGAAAAAGAAAPPTDTIDFQLGPSTCSTQAPQDVEVQFMPSAPGGSAFQLAPPSQPEEVADPATLPDLMAAAAAAASCAAGAGCSSSAKPASRVGKPADEGGASGSGGGGGTVTLAAPVFSQPPQPLVLLPPACSEHEGSHSRASPSKADDARENAGGFSFPVTPSVAGAQTDHRIFKSWPSVRSSCTSEVIAASDDDHVAADYADDDYLRSKPSSRSTSQNLGDLSKAFPRGLLHDEEAAGGSGAKASGSGYEGWSFAKGMQPAVSSGGAVADGSREPSLDPPPAADAPQTTSASCISEPSTSAPYLTCMPPGLLQHMAGAASAPAQQPAGSSPSTSSAAKHHAGLGLPRRPPGSGASSVTGAPAHGSGLPVPPSSSSHGTPQSPKGPPLPTHLPAGIRRGGGRSSGLPSPVPGTDSGAGRVSSDSGAGGASSPAGAAAGAAAASDPREPRQSTGAPAIMPALEISGSNTSQVSSHHITPDSPPLSPSAAAKAKAGTAAVRPAAPTAAATAAASAAATASGDVEVEEQFHEARSGSGQDEETGSASSDDDGTHEDGLVYEPEDDLALEAAAALEWEQLHHQSGSRMSEARSPSSGDVLQMQYSTEGQHLEYDPEYIAHEYDILSLRVYHKRNRTGFEETKDLPIIRGDLIAGQYQVTNFLGSAAFSRAVEARDIKHNHMRVCLKIIKNNKDYFDQSLDEIKLLKYVNSHDPEDKWGIVRLYDYFYYKEHLFLVCELLRANLYDYQKHRRDTHQPNYFTNARIQSIARQVLRSLYFIHTLGLIHSDLKPENILMKSYERCEVKVIDLGSSCYVTDQLSSYVQSRSYRAPEVILGLPYDQKIDIWSLGCILAEMASGQVLFQNDSLATLLARLEGILGPVPEWMLAKGRYANRFYTRRGQLYEKSPQTGRYELLLPKKTSLRHRVPEADDGLLSFIAYLLHVDPHKRPSAAEALQHPWFEVRYPSDGTLFDDTASW